MTFVAVEARQIDVLGVFEDLRGGLAFGVAQHPVAVVEVAVQLHVADGDEAVEPGVGHRLHRLRRSRGLEPDFTSDLRAEATSLGKAWPPMSSYVALHLRFRRRPWP